jgi:hypothetical protein
MFDTGAPYNPELVWLSFFAANDKDRFIGGAGLRARNDQAIEQALARFGMSRRTWVLVLGIRYPERFPPELVGQFLKPNRFNELDGLVWIGSFVRIPSEGFFKSRDELMHEAVCKALEVEHHKIR